MAYTFLDSGLNPIGVLTNKGGQTNNYWGDQITHSIATGNDVLTSVSLSIDKETTNIDTSGNQKEWNHTIQGLSFGIDGIGKEVNELNYLVYKDGEMGRNYLMTITQVDESLTQSGFHFKTIQGINSAAYDLSRKTLRAKEFGVVATGSVVQGTAQNILGYIFDGLGWDVRTIGSFPSIDYSIQDGVTAQSVLQDVIKLFDSSVDAYVLINNLSTGSNVFTGGGSIKRVFDFSTDIGRDEGQTIRLNKNLVSLTKTGARDSMYTKLFVSGNGITIGPANNGSDYIVDDDANKEYNVLGANSVPVQYLEGAISNSAISDPQALLTWGKKQLSALNHPRFNYVVSSVDGKNVHLGDTVVIQDLKASQPIMLKSKIISKTLSFADPQTDSFVVGEFSPIVITSRNGNTDDIIQMINQANQVASEANEKASQANTVASSAAVKADEAISKADSAVNESKEYADNLSEKNTELVNSLSSDLQSKSDSLYASQQTIASQASAYTDSAVADANAKAVQIGQTTAQNAQKALDEKATTLQQSIDTKVAKTDYDKKTGELTTSVNTAQQTADTATQTIGTYKQTNDKRVSAAETNIKANADAIALTASKTDLNKATGELSGSIGDLQVKSNSITQTVSDLQTKVNDLGQVNQLFNTEFTPDFSGWYLGQSTFANVGDVFKAGTPLTSDNVWLLAGGKYQSSNVLKHSYTGINAISSDLIPVGANVDITASVISYSTLDYNGTVSAAIYLRFYDSNKAYIASQQVNSSKLSAWTQVKFSVVSPANTNYVSFNLLTNGNAGVSYYSQPMMVFDNKIGSYSVGNYNNNSQLAQVKITADGVYQTVNNPQTGLNTRVSTAEGNINTIKSNVDGMSNTVTETADGLTREISDRQTGDSNTLQAGKDFTTSQIKSYDTGMQSQIGQMSDGILATVSTTNLVVDSSLLNGIDNWEVLSGDRKWYYSGLTMYKGVASIGINVSNSSGSYNRINSKSISTGSFGGNTVYVSVDVLARSIGTSSTDYLIVYVYEQDINGNNINSTSVTGTLTATNNNWVNYRKKITLNSNTKSLYIHYQMRGNGNVYVSRPYVGTVELPAGGYIPGSNNNNSTVLSLLKDNWSIGIADNSGALISGINGDKSGTVISGDKIVLDGKVTVTDDFNASKIITRGLATTNATIEKTLTMGSYGNITASYDKNGSFPTSTNLNVQYILKGGYTFSRDGILLSGKSQRNSDISSSPVVSVGSSGYVLNTWDSNLSLAESNIKISATNTKGYLVNTSVSSSLTSVPDATIDINPYFITMKAQSSQTTISSTAVTSDSINASKSLWSGGDANIAGSLNVTGSISSSTDSVFNKSLEAKGYLTSGQDIRLGWSLTKNGVGIYPSKFNGIPGIHIAGTNSGIVINESANKFYVVMGGHWNEMTMTGNWGTGSWVN